MPAADHSPDPRVVLLVGLVDELLDAHCDTVCLAENGSEPDSWAAHLDYLRALQRVGQHTLAEVTTAPVSGTPSATDRPTRQGERAARPGSGREPLRD